MKFALFGCSSIAGRMAAAIKHHPDIEIKTAVSRRLEKAEKFAQEWDIPHYSNDYQAVLDDPEIDAVYIALPHQLHLEYTLAALRNKKAVLCEKPAVLYPKDMELIQKAVYENQTFFMEAMKTRFVPAWKKIQMMVEEGVIGDIERIEVSLCNNYGEMLKDPNRYYNQPIQGGGIYDGGVYALNWLLEYLNGPAKILNTQVILEDGVDRDVQMELDFGGKKASFECSMLTSKPKTAVIRGTKGTIIAYDLHRPVKFDLIINDKKTEFEEPYEFSDMYSQLDAFYQTWKEEKLENDIMSIDNSMKQAFLLDQIHQAALGEGAAGIKNEV